MAGGGGGRSPRFRCVACGRYRVRGTHIRQRFLCGGCEARLLATSASEPAYDLFVTRLRGIWPESGETPGDGR